MTLSTPRLTLKPWTPAALNNLFASQPKEAIKQTLGYATDKEYESQLRKYTEGYEQGKRPFITFQMVLNETGETVGYAGFHTWVKEHMRAELGYHMMGEQHKRKGLMFEAVQRIIAYGFNELNLHRIEACTATDNLASIALLYKCGFTREGLMRQHYHMDGVWYDSELFALVKEEDL